MASPSARVSLICCFHLCADLLWIFLVHSDTRILPESEHLDSGDCFTHGILSYWRSTATPLPCHSVGRLMFCPCRQSLLIIHGLWSFTAFPAWGLRGIHYSFILSTCWLRGVFLLKSWPFAWLSGVTSWPANCLTLTTYCPVRLWNGWRRLLTILWIWLHVGIALPCPLLLLRAPGIAFPLSASADSAELLFCCLAHALFGAALSTCWMSGIFPLPFHLLLGYSVPLAALWVCLLTDTCSLAVLSTCFYA